MQARFEITTPSLDVLGGRDPRIKVSRRTQNGNISIATNAAAELARGDYLVFLDHDDLLHPDAIAHLAIRVDAETESDLIYTDDDKITVEGKRHSPQFKPDWSPELLLSYCYVGHVKLVRTRLYREVGGMHAGFEGSQDHDFLLRAAERARHVGHISQVLYHWRDHPGSTATDGRAKPQSFEAGRRAVEEAFHRRGVRCRVVQPEWAIRAGCAIFEPIMPDEGPSVAIVSTASTREPLARLLKSIGPTTYQNYRVYIIDQGTRSPQLEDLLDLRFHVLDLPISVTRTSLAARRNAAAEHVTEDLLVFISDNIEVTNPRWLSQLVGWSRLPGVGAVGPRIIHHDHRIASAGYVLGVGDGLIGRAFEKLPRAEQGYLKLARVTRNCEAIPADCLLTPRALFLRLGGFDGRRFSTSFHDADYGLRLADQGYRCVLCGDVDMALQRGSSKHHPPEPREAAKFRERTSGRRDRFHGPHLSLEDSSFRIKPTLVPVPSPRPPIRMLAVTHNLNWEGAPLIQFDLLVRLKELGVIDPSVLCPKDGPLRSRYEANSIPVELAGEFATGVQPPALDDERIRSLGGWICKRRFDLVHANTARTYWAIAGSRQAAVPAVWSIHESEPWLIVFGELSRKHAKEALCCLDHPYRVVFASRSTAQVWRPLEKISNFTIVPTPLDIPRFRTMLSTVDRASARQRLDLDDREICVLSLGTICDRKGQHDLVHAFASLAVDVASRIRCLMVGARDELPYCRELRRLVAGLPADRRHRFTIVAETGETAEYLERGRHLLLHVPDRELSPGHP